MSDWADVVEDWRVRLNVHLAPARVVSNREARALAEALMRRIREKVREGGRVVAPGLGSFIAGSIAAHPLPNGKMTAVSAKVFFRAGAKSRWKP